uniref:Predicted protein n=1 Tax=Hordeum vulgare subsp. vulgare TaxID=112509 RepID=F2D8A1_HORVV|nr:predicted protein [Hordeum vulgare subsp. vulgare]
MTYCRLMFCSICFLQAFVKAVNCSGVSVYNEVGSIQSLVLHFSRCEHEGNISKEGKGCWN